MKERDPSARQWDVETVGQFLGASPEKTGDIAFGDGLRFQVSGAPVPTSVELFAGASVARITTPDTQLTPRQIEPPTVQTGHIVFERAPDGAVRHRAELTEGGEVSFGGAHSERSRSSNDEPTEADSRSDRRLREANLERAVRMLTDALEGCAGDDPSCPHCGPARAFAAEVLERQPETGIPAVTEQERLTVTGRLGAAPSFRVTRNGVPIARFPVAVRGEDGATSWETVVVFGEKAARLRGTLERGQAVEVVGYLHDREIPKRDGTFKTVHEIYAAVVRTR